MRARSRIDVFRGGCAEAREQCEQHSENRGKLTGPETADESDGNREHGATHRRPVGFWAKVEGAGENSAQCKQLERATRVFRDAKTGNTEPINCLCAPELETRSKHP